MMIVWFYTLVSVFLVSLISLVGLFTFGMRAERLRGAAHLLCQVSLPGHCLGIPFSTSCLKFPKRGVLESRFRFRSWGVSSLFLIIEKVIHLQQYHSHGIWGSCP